MSCVGSVEVQIEIIEIGVLPKYESNVFSEGHSSESKMWRHFDKGPSLETLNLDSIPYYGTAPRTILYFDLQSS